MRTLALGLTAALLTTLTGLATPAMADTGTSVSGPDAWGDVSLFKPKALTKREKKSIDIRSIEVTRVDEGMKVTLRVKKVIRVKKFRQMFVVELRERPAPDDSRWITDALFASKGIMNFAFAGDLSNPDDYEWCNRMPVTVRPLRGEVEAIIPNKCSPDNGVSIRAIGATIDKRGKIFSVDRARITGFHDLGATTP